MTTGPGETVPGGADRGGCLCLSGGGFRATLFHLGVVLRLNELGVLARLSTVTSVSGGSILNGVLATRWPRLTLGTDGVYTNLIEEVARPIRDFCSKDLRTAMLIGTRLRPANWRSLARDWFSVSADFLAEGYKAPTGADSPTCRRPARAAGASSLRHQRVDTGACWHFHGGPSARMGDFFAGHSTRGRSGSARPSRRLRHSARLHAPSDEAAREWRIPRRPADSNGSRPSSGAAISTAMVRPRCSPTGGSTTISPSSRCGGRTRLCWIRRRPTVRDRLPEAVRRRLSPACSGRPTSAWSR